MHPRRIHVLPGSLGGETVRIDGAEAHYLLHVIRMRAGESLTVFDGEGGVRRAVVEETGRDSAVLRLGERFPPVRRRRLFAVAQALLKRRAMETVVQRCTELGAAGIIAFHGERSVGRLPQGGALEGRKERWRRIALEACRQSRRDLLPAIEFAGDAAGLAAVMRFYDAAVLASLATDAPSLMELLTRGPLRQAQRLLLVIGPEGDLSPRETRILAEAGAVPCILADAVLRAETAAVSAAAVAAQACLSRGSGEPCRSDASL